MLTKRQVMEAYDLGVSLAKGPVINATHDEEGNACAFGALMNGAVGKRFTRHSYITGSMNAAMNEMCEVSLLPSSLPGWVKEMRDQRTLRGEGSRHEEAGNIYYGNSLGCCLASVFNVTRSFSEARAFLDKELTRLVSKGLIQEEVL